MSTVDIAAIAADGNTPPSLLDAVSQLGRIDSLVEAIWMAASDLGDIRKTDALQNVAEVIHGDRRH
ncbi:MAG: hypothetical protein KF874_14605 [Rhizobiaceae bacterium]|nr:hypothetical protein [Rhizobiaceae bacterium]